MPVWILWHWFSSPAQSRRAPSNQCHNLNPFTTRVTFMHFLAQIYNKQLSWATKINLSMWCCVSQKLDYPHLISSRPITECENVCSTPITIIIPRLKKSLFFNIPLSNSRKRFTYQTVFLSQPRKHHYVVYISYKTIFLYYFNWKIKICLSHAIDIDII